MSRRTARWLAWALWGLFVLMVAGVFSLVLLTGSGDGDQLFVVLSAGFATVGALVASREPRNAAGWLLLAIGIAFAFQALVDAYVIEPGRPGELAVAWVANWAWYVWIYAAGLLLPLVFPNGRPLSPRWRWAVWLGGAALALSIATEGLGSGPLDVEREKGAPPLENPLAVGGVAGDVVSAANFVSNILAATGFVLGIVSLVLRLRRSHGREHQQVKWFAYAGTLALVGLVGLVMAMVAVVGEVFYEDVDDSPTWMVVLGNIGWATGLLAIIVGIPTAVGIAILRHQLYDVDVVIKRTLVYGTLTLLLAATYLTLVLTFRLLLDPVTGQSDLAVAASTLAVAALFRPARGRVLAAVDRRFFRGRYDAAQTVESFVGRLRQEVDLDEVSSDLGGVVRETMQPAHLSLWLRSTP